MAMGLASYGVPFHFYAKDEVAAALRGDDEVRVGDGPLSWSYDELAEIRPDVLDRIRWDPIPQLGPITVQQLQRVLRVEQPDGVP